MKNKFDFSGYATKVDLKCADGRVIRKDAFKDNDGQTVPLVWQHIHTDPTNVLGHALLENKEDGVYAFCAFNDSEKARNTKLLVEHGDITALSIHANQLQQKGTSVLHGVIREVSLVLAGANPGALIDNLSIEHSDGTYETDDSEAIIYTGEVLSLTTEEVAHEEKAPADEKTMGEVYATFNEEQKGFLYMMLDKALDGDTVKEEVKDETPEEVKHEATEEEKKEVPEKEKKEEEKIEHSDKGGTKMGGEEMKTNVFEGSDKLDANKKALTHSQIQTILADAQKCGSLKEAVLSHVVTYGIENIDYLFPDAKTVTSVPEIVKRDMEWVPGVISGTKHTPFSRIKSVYVDITEAEARAKGYVTGARKVEEIIKLLRRTTLPTTIYKKQKLDREDIIDITDLDVVSWLKAEMRVMLDEELARVVLIGDGRALISADKIDEECIRPIYTDDDVYAHHVTIAADKDTAEVVEEIIRARKNYKGSGSPVFYTTSDMITNMLLLVDTLGRRLYSSEAELASILRVSKIVEVPVMEDATRIDTEDGELNLIGIIVNLKDYTIGADKGGQISMFDDFDIDYNQYKYLIETRCSGALIRPKSALVIEQIPTEG